MLVRHERALEDGVVAAGRAHAEDVPGFLDRDAGGVPRQEAVHDAGGGRIARVEAVQAQPRPYRCQAAERFAAGEAVAAVHLLGLGDRHQDRGFVAALGVSRGEDLAGHRVLEDPFERPVAAPPEVGGDADPVVVHVGAERGGRGVGGETPGFPGDVGQREAEAAELPRHRHPEVAGLAQVVEILLKEAVFAVVDGGAGAERLERGVGDHAGGDEGHVVGRLSCWEKWWRGKKSEQRLPDLLSEIKPPVPSS